MPPSIAPVRRCSIVNDTCCSSGESLSQSDKPSPNKSRLCSYKPDFEAGICDASSHMVETHQLILCNVVPLRQNCDCIKSFISIRLGAGQREVLGSAAAAASPGNLLEMQVPGPTPIY